LICHKLFRVSTPVQLPYPITTLYREYFRDFVFYRGQISQVRDCQLGKVVVLCG
jgi:hypothetical protein